MAKVCRYIYDPAGNLNSETKTVNGTTDTTGVLYSSTLSPTGRVKEVWYDSLGRTRRVDINGRIVKRIEVDERILIITDEKQAQTRKAFDEWGNLTRKTLPDGSIQFYYYAPGTDRLLEKMDEKGQITRYSYPRYGMTSFKLIKKINNIRRMI